MFKAGVLHHVTCCERLFVQVMMYVRGVREECHKWTDWVRTRRKRTNWEAYRRARSGSGNDISNKRRVNNGRIKW